MLDVFLGVLWLGGWDVDLADTLLFFVAFAWDNFLSARLVLDEAGVFATEDTGFEFFYEALSLGLSVGIDEF